MKKKHTITKKRNIFIACTVILALVVAGAATYGWWPRNDERQERGAQAKSYIGLTLAEAETKAEKEHLVLEAYSRDDRLNIAVEKGVVTGAEFDDRWSNEAQAKSYVGLALAEAEAKAKKEFLVTRLSRKDGAPVIDTGVGMANRLNIAIAKGRITDARFDEMR